MREPLTQGRSPQQQIAQIVSQQAPTGGWNARDALANMKPGEAVLMRNWYPRTTDLVIRGGQADHLTGAAGTTKTLAVYNSATGTNKMFAATDTGIYDSSSAGVAGASVATSTNGYWQTLNFGDGTTSWLIMVNGTDKPNYYSGAAWTAVDGVSTPALTGLTTTSIIGVAEYNGRLFFIEKNKLKFWYLPAGAAGGALTAFDLSSFANKGGYLVAVDSWSFDSGAGIDDYIAFVTSEGQVIVYKGTDPSSAANWVRRGTYYIGKPIGRRCLFKYGGDLVLITQVGGFPLSAVLQSSAVEPKMAVTNKIEKAFNEASNLYRGNVGWEAIFYPAQSAMLFNIPTVEGSEAKQYVLNINSPKKPWCEFSNWNATCFGLFNNDLYYGVPGGVKKAWTTMADSGANIVVELKEAFQNYGSGKQKRATLYRPILQVDGSISYLTGIDIDFRDTPIVGEATYSVTSGALWDVAVFDAAYWAATLDIVRQWSSPQENIGTWFAGKLKISTNALEVHFLASDIMFESGGGI
jgi:hypothetical protein